MKNTIQAAQQQYLTKAQAALYSGLSQRTIDYARVRGILSSYKIGKRVLLKRGDIDAWIEQFRVGADLDRLVDETVAEVIGR